MKNKRLWWWLFYAAIILLNTLPVILFHDRADINIFSFLFFLLILASVVRGVVAYALRHKENYLLYPHLAKSKAFDSDDEETYTDEYQKSFQLMLAIHYAGIPFYIPCAFFLSEPIPVAIWACIIYGIPNILMTVIDGIDRSKKAKRRRHAQSKKW